MTTVKKTPRIGRQGKKIFTRRATNEQIMQASLTKRGFVRLRIQVCVQDEHAQYLGWQGSGGVVELQTPKQTLEFVEMLDATLVELCKELGHSFRKKDAYYANSQSKSPEATAGGHTR